MDYVGETVSILAKILGINVFILGPRRVLWWRNEKGGMENDGIELGDKLGEPVGVSTEDNGMPTSVVGAGDLPVDKADALV